MLAEEILRLLLIRPADMEGVCDRCGRAPLPLWADPLLPEEFVFCEECWRMVPVTRQNRLASLKRLIERITR